MSKLKKIVRLFSITLIIIVGNFMLLLIYLNGIRWVDIMLQQRHLNQLEKLYATDYQPLDETLFIDFDKNTSTLRLNEIQMLASHNSYKKMGSSIGKFFVGLGDSFAEARALRYEHDTLTNQLNVGIRSFELDLRYRRGDFEVVHVPLVDNSSHVPKLKLGLEEIKLWSDNNPNHIPIIVLFELKNDWMMLDPALKDFDDQALQLLDQLLIDTFSDKLITPQDVIGSHSSLREAITTDGWPLLSDTLGKIIFVLHPGKYTTPYYQMDPTFVNMVMFPAANISNINQPYASFVVHNNPSIEEINPLVEQNFIVRTRIDSNLDYENQRKTEGILSGAQLLTSDFLPNHKFKTTTYVAYLYQTYTIIENAYLNQ